MARTAYPIVLFEGDIGYKVSSIIFLSDGGFSVVVPYHNAETGLLLKSPVPCISPGTYIIPRESIIQEFTASNRPKLSIHYDGFCQFSSDLKGTIRSGRDSETGQPKGLGIFTQPLSQPIESGPTFGITVWGMHDYKKWKGAKKGESPIRFHNYYYRNADANTWNSYLIEGYVFPRSKVSPSIKHRNGNYYLKLVHMNFEIPGTVFKWFIVPELHRDYLIGVIVSRTSIGFSSSSGFCMSGPTQIIGRDHQTELDILCWQYTQYQRWKSHQWPVWITSRDRHCAKTYFRINLEFRSYNAHIVDAILSSPLPMLFI